MYSPRHCCGSNLCRSCTAASRGRLEWTELQEVLDLKTDTPTGWLFSHQLLEGARSIAQELLGIKALGATLKVPFLLDWGTSVSAQVASLAELKCI